MNKNKAFTLIEILVAIAIIALLSTIVFGLLGPARAEAQDKKKMQQIGQVSIAIELHKSLVGSAPLADDVDVVIGTAYPENSEQYIRAMQELVDSGAISEIPRSKNGQDYFYILEDAKTGVLGAVLNSSSAIEQNGGCAFTDADYSCDLDSDAANKFDRERIVSIADDGVTGCGIVSGFEEPPTAESCFTFDSNSGTITDYDNNCTKDVVIPSSIGGVDVVATGYRSLAYNSLTSVIIPGSIEVIGNESFHSNQITSATINEGVTTINQYAFVNNSLSSVIIPDSVTTIGYSGFGGSNPLSDPGSVSIYTSTTYDRDAFPSGCTMANGCIEVRGSGGATADGCFTFDSGSGTITGFSQSCIGIDLVIPSTIDGVPVTATGYRSFRGYGLTSVTIPSSITTIGNESFHTNQINSVTIPSSVTTINQYAFVNNLLSSVYIPNNVNTIGYQAFGGSNPISDPGSVSIPSGKSYDNMAFPSGCTINNGCIVER